MTTQRNHVPRRVHIPYVVDRDEDGIWCAHAKLAPGVGAHGEGLDEASAIADLREALTGLIAEFGIPRELVVDIPVAV
jgi:predicted RNase H-like HicB family nuclease